MVWFRRSSRRSVCWTPLLQAAVVIHWLAFGCSEGGLVTLGEATSDAGSPPGGAPLHFTSIRRLDELLGKDGRDDNPTLTADLLEIYFSSTRSGGVGDVDVWRAVRRSREEAFGTPELVEAASSPEYESSPAISFDGLSLWVGSEREGGIGELDIWLNQRSGRGEQFTPPVLVPELSSEEKDIPRPPGFEGRFMPIGSQRESPGTYRTYLARKDGDQYVEPQVVSGLVLPDRSTVDGFLSEDGLSLYFNAAEGEDNGGELYVASRSSPSETFSNPLPLEDLNTDDDERDPWLSPDGTRFFFASDRDGKLSIYEAVVEK